MLCTHKKTILCQFGLFFVTSVLTHISINSQPFLVGIVSIVTSFIIQLVIIISIIIHIINWCCHISGRGWSECHLFVIVDIVVILFVVAQVIIIVVVTVVVVMIRLIVVVVIVLFWVEVTVSENQAWVALLLPCHPVELVYHVIQHGQSHGVQPAKYSSGCDT